MLCVRYVCLASDRRGTRALTIAAKVVPAIEQVENVEVGTDAIVGMETTEGERVVLRTLRAVSG